MLKQGLQQTLQQKLSPQQIQVIKLLEVPAMQLEQRIKKEIEENPALEEGEADYESDAREEGLQQEADDAPDEDPYTDEFSIEDYLPDDDDIPQYRLAANNWSPDDEQREIPYSGTATFHESLLEQLALRRGLAGRRRALAEYLIGNIDDDGYLRRKLPAIVDDLLFASNLAVEVAELEDALSEVQELDPAGVGARDLQECLRLQLERMDPAADEVRAARKIVAHYFAEFTRKHYDKIMARLDIDESELRAAIEVITRLNPKPGGAFNDPAQQNLTLIIPDFILAWQGGRPQVTLNAQNVPELHISKAYTDMLEEYSGNKNRTRKDREAISFVKQKLDSARGFIEAIRQRQDTLLRTMEAILAYQQRYFATGDERDLRPMILKDVADATGLDISTISRVANSKYIQTEFGILSLKSFFSEAMTNDAGEEVSTREIKKILRECIDAEDKRRPLTDDKLTRILGEKGYPIARRTVAKYREQLNMPVARLRKEL